MPKQDPPPTLSQIDIPPLDMTTDQSTESSPDSANGLITPATSSRPSVVSMEKGALLVAGQEEGMSKRTHADAVATPRSRSPVGIATSPSSPRLAQDTTPKAREAKLPAYVSATDPTLSTSRERVVSPSRPNGMLEQQRAYLPRSVNAADEVDSPRTRSPFSTMPVNLPTNHAQGINWPLSKTEPVRAVEKVTPDVGFWDSPAYWLTLYFFFNLGLTLFNKVVLVSFPFPYTLTGLHALSGCVGCYIALERGAFTPARLTRRENLILAAFSVLYTINIAVSNISLKLVTVPFHQVVRSSTPLFTILIAAVMLGQRFTMRKLASLLPVVVGVGFATYGDYYFTAWGLILTLLGTFLAALKTVVTNLIQTGAGGRLKLHPLDLLMRMSPLAFVQCVIYGWYTGELDRVRRYGALHMDQSKAVALIMNGVIAFGLNIVSFTANKKAGALTMTVAANCKQVMTIALAVFLFNLTITFTNGIGILLTLVGGAFYGWVEYDDKQKKVAKAQRA